MSTVLLFTRTDACFAYEIKTNFKTVIIIKKDVDLYVQK